MCEILGSTATETETFSAAIVRGTTVEVQRREDMHQKTGRKT